MVVDVRAVLDELPIDDQAIAQQLDLVILLEGDPRLLNPYGVIAVNPALHPGLNDRLAQAFIDWLVSAETQAAINQYQVNGHQLFYANAPECDDWPIRVAPRRDDPVLSWRPPDHATASRPGCT